MIGIAVHPPRLAWPGRWLRYWSPPLRRREFWIAQALVLGIAFGHALTEWTSIVDMEGAEFLPVSLYLLPVVYAALSFGMRGAAGTAVWSFLLTLPNIALWHRGAGAVGELWQATLVLAVGFFVGERVDREREARRQAEARERERRASEDRYRGLFAVAADPILLLDQAGRILEANAAAMDLLKRPADALQELPLSELLPQLWTTVSGRAPSAGPLAVGQPPARRWIQPVPVPFRDADGQPRLLAQLRDVTLEVERQQFLETFARRTVAAREEERRRVARDLHDGPLQTLMLLWRSLDGCEDSGASGTSRMAEARRRAEEVADELRRFSRDLRPSVLDDLGLAPALKAETASVGARAGVQVEFSFDGDARRLPTEIELSLLRICQEALRNIEKHASATRVGVRLETRSDRYRLQVADDGVGVGSLPPPAELVGAGRLGVVGMQERARLVGATCRVSSRSPRGTVVEVVGSCSDGATDETSAR